MTFTEQTKEDYAKKIYKKDYAELTLAEKKNTRDAAQVSHEMGKIYRRCLSS